MLESTIVGLVLLALCLLVALVLPRRFTRRLGLTFVGLAQRHPAASLVGIGVMVVAVRLSLLPVLPRPVPITPDERSYLFLGQTLAGGRVSNPAHPMWRHFETLFILQQPTYASIYPPVQGAILASALILFGEPWVGVLGSVACMCIAIVWMLRAYVSRSWALYGGVLSAVGYGVLSYWTNSYWGGAGAAIGGALVFGAVPRILANSRCRDAAILGLGLLTVANSRPFEGFLAAVPVALLMARHFYPAVRKRGPLRTQAAVLGCVVCAGAVLTGWYNWRVTKNPFHLPHALYSRQYAAAPAFVWQRPLRLPEYPDRLLRDAHVSFGVDYSEYSTFDGAARKSLAKIARIAKFYWGPLWAVALLGLPEFVREHRFRTLVCSLALCVTGILLTVGFQVHYAAPCTAVFVHVGRSAPPRPSFVQEPGKCPDDRIALGLDCFAGPEHADATSTEVTGDAPLGGGYDSR